MLTLEHISNKSIDPRDSGVDIFRVSHQSLHIGFHTTRTFTES